MSGGAPDVASLAVAAGLAAALAHLGTPLAIAAARATGFLDAPVGGLKQHHEPTPYLGGLAVFVPFLTATALVFVLDAAFLAILLAATLATLLGLMDDFGAMRPGVKLAGQVIVVLVLLRADVALHLEALPDWANLGLTAVWMLAVMNAVNFLDIMDGLAATVSLVAALAFLVLALLTGDAHLGSVSAALAGALAGYLRFSLPRARIFLGDAGSLFLGTTLGALALALDYSRDNDWAVLAPLFVLAVPTFEVAFTTIVRGLRGRAPWRGSPDHVALRLRRVGLSVRQVVLVAASTGVVGGAMATWILRLPEDVSAWIVGTSTAVAVALALALARVPDPPNAA